MTISPGKIFFVQAYRLLVYKIRRSRGVERNPNNPQYPQYSEEPRAIVFYGEAIEGEEEKRSF